MNFMSMPRAPAWFKRLGFCICEESYMQHTVKDTSVWTWKDAVISKSESVLQKLGFL